MENAAHYGGPSSEVGEGPIDEDETDWKLWSRGAKPWKPKPYRCLKHHSYRDFLLVYCTVPGQIYA